MEKDSLILITGSEGMVGKSLTKELKKQGFSNLILPSSEDLDLRDQKKTFDYFKKNRPDYVFHLAAKVGGIAANIESPAEFLYDNLAMGANVLEASRRFFTKKILFLGSSCVYPKECPQPMKEEHLFSGKLEPTNEGYALGKICVLKLCEYYNKQYGTNFISLMPPNLYGPGDHFNAKNSHVVSALITKFNKAKKESADNVCIWGTGVARREFLYVEDLVDAIIYFMENYSSKETGPFLNVGTKEDISIKELALLIKEIVGFKGGVVFDKTKPDGMLRKMVDTSKANKMGWSFKTNIREGIAKTYEYFKKTPEYLL
jgi:GDP-L-fucose synthase